MFKIFLITKISMIYLVFLRLYNRINYDCVGNVGYNIIEMVFSIFFGRIDFL